MKGIEPEDLRKMSIQTRKQRGERERKEELAIPNGKKRVEGKSSDMITDLD